MLNKDIIKTLKKDIKELKENNIKGYSFRKVFVFNKYFIDLIFFVSENDSCFNKPFREIQFNTKSNANKLIDLINKEFKQNLKRFD